MDNFWYNKYLKYKNKYLNLKMNGGINEYDNIINTGYYEEKKKERDRTKQEEKQEERDRIKQEDKQEEKDRIKQEERDKDRASANRGKPPGKKFITKLPPHNPDDFRLLEEEEKINIDISKINLEPIISTDIKTYEINRLLNSLGQNFGYLTDSKTDAEQRIKFLFNYTQNLDEAYKLYNQEKKNMKEDYEKLFNLYSFSNINTHYYKQIEMSELSESYDNIGIIKLDGKDVVYKELDYLNKNVVPQLDRINQSYEFVKMCIDKKKEFDSRNKTFDYSGEQYNINFVNIHNNIVITNNGIIGYTMDLVKGKRLEDFKSHKEFKSKKEIIIKAIEALIDRLTDIEFLINDLHLRNLMWDDETNTLTLIDITPNSFNRNINEVKINNETVKIELIFKINTY